jgi:S1-C subfamily serine protease
MVLPAVVSIETDPFDRADPPAGRTPRSADLYLDLFRGDEERGISPASGSGFIVQPDGLVVTNYHVVADADRIFVTMRGGEPQPAEVVGLDPSTDIAVLRIAAREPLPAVVWGQSDSVRVGDWAVAIGNPFGKLEGTVTVGVVSATGRANIDVEGGTPLLQDFLQTDASINLGNSGGPLVDVRGRVIGMNTAVSPAGQGIGFAIPVDLLRRTVAQIVESGRAIRGFVGIYPQELTADLAAGRGVVGLRGVLIGQVLVDTPASRAGLRVGDVITHIGERAMTGVASFRLAIAEAQIGVPVEFVVQRGGRSVGHMVTLVERPGIVQAPPEERAQPADPGIALGIEAAELTAALRRDLELDASDAGVAIVSVRHGSAAARAGVEPGMVIHEVGDRPVRSVGEYLDAVERAMRAERPVVLLVTRSGLTRFIAVSARAETDSR